MRSFRYVLCAVVLPAIVWASSSSAANWDPPGAELTAFNVGPALLTGNHSAQLVVCTQLHTLLAVTASQPDLLSTTHGIHNPFNFTNCHAFGSPATVTTFGTWKFTATNTTTVDATFTGAGPGGSGPIALVIPHALSGCTITIDAEVGIPNNEWDGVNHRLVINNQSTFTLTSNAPCVGVVPMFGSLDLTLQLPAAAGIT
jgi:hypothetical protein